VLSSGLQTDYSPQRPPKSDANAAGLSLPNQQPAASPTRQDVLNSWKEIAAYLGRGVRTVQRWELDAGLPVHRPKRKNRSAVVALSEELDQWLTRTPVRSNGDGNGIAGSVAPDIASVLLELARDLLAEGERLAQLDQKHRPETEKLVRSVRAIVRGLTLASGGNVAAQPMPDYSPKALKIGTDEARRILPSSPRLRSA
jgi:hypothetical protein